MLKKLRTRLFGFKKSDVYGYIAEMDENASAQLEKKDEEIAELKAKLAEYEQKIAELEKNKEAIVSALMLADKKAKEIISDAEKSAKEITQKAEDDAKEKRESADREICEQRETADREIKEQKSNVNREIEIKRKAIKNYYASENRKIDQIKGEVERMRQASIEAINNFEKQLREVERMTENSGSFLDSAKEYALSDSVPESFADVDGNIPVHIVETVSE